MKKLVALLGAATLAFVMTGCVAVPDEPDETPGNMRVPDTIVFEQAVPEGGTVTCIASKRGQSGGLSCDWYGYFLEQHPEE